MGRGGTNLGPNLGIGTISLGQDITTSQGLHYMIL